jgi:hypothetical protein
LIVVFMFFKWATFLSVAGAKKEQSHDLGDEKRAQKCARRASSAARRWQKDDA